MIDLKEVSQKVLIFKESMIRNLRMVIVAGWSEDRKRMFEWRWSDYFCQKYKTNCKSIWIVIVRVFLLILSHYRYHPITIPLPSSYLFRLNVTLNVDYKLGKYIIIKGEKRRILWSIRLLTPELCDEQIHKINRLKNNW